MPDSIFDPASPQVERSGSTFTGPSADNASQMPPDLTDGKVQPDEITADATQPAQQNDHDDVDSTADLQVKAEERARQSPPVDDLTRQLNPDYSNATFPPSPPLDAD